MLSRALSPGKDAAFTLLRVATGLMFSFHGMQKILGVLAPSKPELFTQIWVGGVIELVGGLAIAFGILTVWAAFLASGTMAVAYVQFHWKLELGSQLLPAINKGELALVYSVVFLFIACAGPGPYSLDALRSKRSAR